MQPLKGRRQKYAWGSTTSIPVMLGLPPDGQPWAEVWYGTHPAGPASLPDGSTLDAVVTADPTALGEASRRAFGDRLSYMVKLLAARQALSIQVHPDRAQAEAGFAREDAEGIDRLAPHRNYRDDWPKPELMMALEPIEALCGFRSPEDAADQLSRLELPDLQPTIDLLRGEGTGADRVRRAFLYLTGLPTAEARSLVLAAMDAARGRSDEGAEIISEVGDEYPGDIGVLVATLLNRVYLEPGQALYLGAGTVHAYLRGSGVEVMANSDNVLRGGLTPKHIDVTELAHVVDFTPGAASTARAVDVAPGVRRWVTPNPEFTLWQLDPRARPVLPAPGHARIVLAVRGEITLGDLVLHPGDAVFVRADENDQTLSGRGLCLMGAPGLE